ncbi:acyltransferase [Paractinoplanes abujensis]|uniref:Peptidoglycan/LPS O-acetylase OafA/YrhL n=1 Tax=Paractinoplanes abujensis TaxID=882441 RepID=A0A7W7CVI5_9ACTN|nr:acyltransferase family protein [Actinoplanes abujensis]MBB4695416.1 peptidoglycan/LPS O-acetylase OafA/YrhL [Actinoplanes abujensis]GID23000.1 acyltransferase [Actinoplanes abujensis]
MNYSVHTPIVGQRPPSSTEDTQGTGTPPAPPRAQGPHIGFRPDIEGLRAIAVVLVVLSHAGISTFAGGYVGVDVFFVISGFLITTLLLKELGKTGTISLPGFYARRAIRLLPVSTVVLVATVVAAWLWLPATRFKSISLDALFSTFYGINWRLAYEGTDYLNATAAPSPLQHLWSLAVEEQFYLVWPLLLLAVWAGRRAHRRALFALSALVVVSLVVSVQQTTSAAPWAYFGSHTRAWELGIGALVAVGAGFLRRTPKALAAVLTWGGLVAVVIAAVTFDEATAFPGYHALLPVLGTAAVIAGGTSAEGWGAGKLIGTGPFRFIGKLSYGWYLWHWPVLMIWPAAFSRDPGIKSNLVFAVAALGLAWVTYHTVENPVRMRPALRSRARNGLALGLVLSASAALFALIIGQFTPPLPAGPAAPDTTAEVAAAADPQARITELITSSLGGEKLPKNLTPKVTDAGAQSPQIYDDQCHFNYTQVEQNRECVYGDPAGAKTMYLIGDSHAAHWFPAVDDTAKNNGWKLVALTKAACQLPQVLTYNSALKRNYTECVTWRDQIVQRVADAKPDLLVMASNDLDNGGIVGEDGQLIARTGAQDDPVWVARWKQTWAKFDGIPKVLLQDTPWPAGDAPECAAENARRLAKCDRPLTKAIAEKNRRELVAEAARTAGIRVIDPTPWFCDATKCPIVVGNVLVYKDNSHMTLAYAHAISPLLDEALFPRK